MNTYKTTASSITLSRRTKMTIIREYIQQSGSDPQSDLFYKASSRIYYAVSATTGEIEHDYEDFDGEWTIAELRPVTFSLTPVSQGEKTVTMQIDQFDGGLFVEAFGEKIMKYDLLTDVVTLDKKEDGFYDVELEVELVDAETTLNELTDAQLKPFFGRVCKQIEN